MGKSKQVLENFRFSNLSSKHIIRVISSKLVDVQLRSKPHFGRVMSAPHFIRTMSNCGSKNGRVRGKSKQLLKISRFSNFSSNHILRPISSKTSKLQTLNMHYFERKTSALHFNSIMLLCISTSQRVMGKSKHALEIFHFNNFSSRHNIRVIPLKVVKLLPRNMLYSERELDAL